MSKERPILFSSDMVKAILDGRKWQTRRVMKPQPVFHPEAEDAWAGVMIPSYWTWLRSSAHNIVLNGNAPYQPNILEWCPYGKVGDRLWVRETFAEMCREADPFCWCDTPELRKEYHYYEYRADTGDKYPGGWDHADKDDTEGRPVWKPSIFMPRAASRILLEVTGVRVERLDVMAEHEQGERDAMAEGFPIEAKALHESATDWFISLWNSINAKRGYGWDTNCWVWVVEFKRIEQ